LDALWVLTAFLLGFAATRVGLPPMVGYLVAGFALNAAGVKPADNIETLADLGIYLLLFSIGLKLRLKSLLKPEVWAGASLHMVITVAVFGCGVYLLSLTGISLFGDLNLKLALLIAFALSFSSTVFAVKVLEERGEMTSLHGRISIGILIMQDIFAVLFLTFSTGKPPSTWALAVIPALFIIRPILNFILDRCGHSELLLLFGFFLALGLGAGGFDLVGLKSDLGALILGILVSNHSKAGELAKLLLNFKDLFLVSFFLQIGLAGIPTFYSLGIAVLLVIVCVFKVGLFFLLLTRFNLRARTAMLGAFSLANYSEFGLLVSYLGVKSGWISGEWLVIIAIALSITFILASMLNAASHSIYNRHAAFLKKFETGGRHPDDQPIDTGDAEIVVFGMGRIGTAVYDTFTANGNRKIAGVDSDPATIREQLEAGRRIIQGDATDPDFWANLRSLGKVRLVILAMQQHAANLYAARQFSGCDYAGLISATAEFDDQIEELQAAGVHETYNLYTEAGTGFADHICEKLDVCTIDE
jgi:predicted Kef-type K+ transport protein